MVSLSNHAAISAPGALSPGASWNMMNTPAIQSTIASTPVSGANRSRPFSIVSPPWGACRARHARGWQRQRSESPRLSTLA